MYVFVVGTITLSCLRLSSSRASRHIGQQLDARENDEVY